MVPGEIGTAFVIRKTLRFVIPGERLVACGSGVIPRFLRFFMHRDEFIAEGAEGRRGRRGSFTAKCPKSARKNANGT